MPSQVKKFSQRKLREKKHQTVSLPTDSVIVDHAVEYSLPNNFSKHFNFYFFNSIESDTKMFEFYTILLQNLHWEQRSSIILKQINILFSLCKQH
jgi:hypothetical protein